MQALRSELERLRRRVEGDAGPPPRPSAPSPDPSLPTAAPSAAPLPRPDFVTSVGPKLLVATGALAFVVFVGLFVKYAWENDWIGPAGRVLSGAVFGLALVALGVRLRGRPYRPLGQGLAGAGLASLYVSAYGAHGFYDLISREAAGALMLAITASAVLLAARLPARLLATLAWTGAYLTPVLLSTGEDRAVSLFLFLLVLDAGALALDRWRPWPETVPLAMLGTTSLYIAWFATFFRAERFDVAAIGLVLFTGVFVAGPRPRARRPGWPARALVIGGIGLSFLAGGADRPAALSESQPRTLGAIAVALATLYLLLGLATIKERSEDRLQVRTLLGLAAVFVTLAIPVQLGLHGITLAWAAEAVLLLALGLRFASPLARAGAYVVLALAAARLFVRHLPLHEGSSFTPVLNAAFGTWLAVILAFAAAFFMRRRARLETALDRAIGPALATLALGLLLTLLTMETEDVFATRARLAGQLALSVLWTLFAMGMLAGGLALRSRPLFYSAYALFAATAVKVVAVDLATLGAVYRMLSFLALALLLMAGAYLNLRFRERLLPKVAAG